MNSSDEYYILLTNTILRSLHRYIVPIFFIFGNIGNVLSILIFSKKSWKKNVCVFYFNICLLFNLCYINSSILGTIFITGFNIKIYNSNIILCKLFYYTSFIFSRYLPTILTLASIDRLLISSQNVDTRLYSSKRLAYLLISITTLFWMIFYFHILIEVNIQQFSPSYFICYYNQSKFYLDFISYSTLIIVSLTFLSMIILSILVLKKVRRLRSIPRQQQQQQQIRTMTKKDFQLLRCLYLHIIIYMISTIVITVHVMYGTTSQYKKQTQLEQAIDNFIFGIGTFLHHIPFCFSCFIFIGISKSFRCEVKRMIDKIFGDVVVPIREEEVIKRENIK